MGDEALATKVASAVTSFLIFVDGAFRGPKTRAKQVDPWRAFAAARRFEYSAVYKPKTIIPKRRTMRGWVHGVGVRIDLADVATASAEIASVGNGKLCVYSDNMLVDMVTISGKALSDVGDEDFDGRFFLRGTEPNVVQRLLTVDVRQALLRFPTGICLNYDNGKIALTWSGDGVIDVLGVDAACDIIVAASTTRPVAGVYR